MDSRGNTALLILGVLFVSAASEAQAQRRPQLPRDNISSAGTIKAIASGIMHVENVGGDQWLIRVEARPEDIILTGRAEQNWLRAGMAVQFNGLFSKRGVAQEAVTNLNVISPREGTRLGVTQSGGGGDTATANLGAFLNEAPSEEPDPTATPATWYRVTGVITKYKLGKMTVKAGTALVRVDLAKDAEILVNVSDYRLAAKGDEIEFEGWHYPGQKAQVHATQVSIKAAKPFGEAPKAKTTTTKKDADKKKADAGKKKKKSRKNNPFPL